MFISAHSRGTSDIYSLRAYLLKEKIVLYINNKVNQCHTYLFTFRLKDIFPFCYGALFSVEYFQLGIFSTFLLQVQIVLAQHK